MDASNQIAQTVWNKGDYIARCVRKWETHFIQTEELLVYRQRKHTKLESLLNDEDFKKECQVEFRMRRVNSSRVTRRGETMRDRCNNIHYYVIQCKL